MNFKIIETDLDLPDVLVYRDRNDDDEDIVTVLAMGKVNEKKIEMIFSQVIQFDFPEYAKSFVRDYSRQSAIEFCKLHNLTNQ